MPGSVRVVETDLSDPIVITGQGMVSSLGLDAETACAAARAGLRRTADLDWVKFASLDGREVECAVGHAAPIITHGFEGPSRLGQLAAGALKDLTNHSLLAEAGRIGLYLSLSSSRRHLTGVELVLDPAEKDFFLEQIEEEEPDFDDRSWTEKVVSLALRQSGIASNTPLRFVTYAGHTGFAEALAAAVAEIGRGDVDLALVGGVDSLIDERPLRWLRLTGRLKDEATPAGLEPGEGAVFLAIERKRQAQRRGARILSVLHKIALAEEDRPRMAGKQPNGRALSECIRSAASDQRNLWLVSDLNGETIRGAEFGNALSRVISPQTHLLPASYPSAYFGDTGAASGGIGACLAQNAFHRSYAPLSSAVIASVDDGAGRSAFSVARLER